MTWITNADIETKTFYVYNNINVVAVVVVLFFRHYFYFNLRSIVTVLFSIFFAIFIPFSKSIFVFYPYRVLFRANEFLQYSHITSSCWPNFNSCHIVCCGVYRLGSNLSTTIEQVSYEIDLLCNENHSHFCLIQGTFFTPPNRSGVD